MTYHTTGAEGADHLTRVIDDAQEGVGARDGRDLVLRAVLPVHQVRQHVVNARVELEKGRSE